MEATFFVKGYQGKLAGKDANAFWVNMDRYAGRYIQRLSFTNFAEFERYLYVCPDEFQEATWHAGARNVYFERGVGGWQEVCS